MEECINPSPLSLDDEEEIDETLERSTGVRVKFLCHDHPLYPTKVSSKTCEGCGEVRVDPAGGYACDYNHRDCKAFYIHKHCHEVTNPSHPTQPLSLTPHERDKDCSVCEQFIGDRAYCFPFSPDVLVCKRCAMKKPYIDPEKSHEHRLLVLIKAFMSFVCDACGENNDQSCLCLCIQCRFTIHRHCVNLPRVICVNRHDHRISHVPRLTLGERDCGVCRKKIDWRFGTYSCSTCSFVSHSRCATRKDVWDGIELEGVPEDDPEDIMPFKVVAEGVIKHFSHQHNLRFITEDDILHDKNKQCYACVLPIFSDPCYICLHCDFILHETCANLPRKKRHMSNKKQFNLVYDEESYFWCEVCSEMCNGFAYMVVESFSFTRSGELYHSYIDVRCVLIYDGYVHKSRPETMLLAPDSLLYISDACSSCGWNGHLLIFMGHDNLFMCYICATMPLQVIYKYDDHLLSLRFSENTTGDYWCEICEGKMDSHKWFYTCDECCTTLHIRCLLGIHPYLRVGSTFKYLKDRDLELEVVRNNFASRPNCRRCETRIANASFFLWRSKGFSYCSYYCIREFV